MKYSLMLLLLLQSVRLAYADINEDLMQFFNQGGVNHHLSSPDVYHDQAAGYYTGGRLMTRTQSRTLQPLSVQLPGVRAGCGGIDLWAGGFSHINSDEFMRFVRSIGQNAMGYAGMLAIKTMSPQIAGLLQDMNHLATKINTFNINSCEIAATMVGSVWPKSQHVQDTLCQHMSTELGFFSDRAQSRHGCGEASTQKRVFSETSKDPRYQDMLKGEYNLTWKVLQKQNFLAGDSDLAALFMTLAGTFIARCSPNGQREQLILPGEANTEALIQALLEGGEVSVYRCTSDKQACLTPQKEKITIQEGLFSKVLRMLQTLETKIHQDTETLSARELAFLNATSLPIYKMLNVAGYYRQSKSPLDVKAYTELVAYDLLFQYLEGVLEWLQQGLTEMLAQQVDRETVHHMSEQLRHLRAQLTQRQGGAYQKLDQTLKLVEQTRLIEKQTHYLWGQSLPFS